MKKSQLRNIIKEAIKEMIDADNYGSATLTTQGMGRSRFTRTGRPPGVMENENEAKFKRGDEVDYLGKKGKVRSAKFNPFDKSFDYTIAYIDQGVRTSSDGVKDRDLKKK
jgi:hypothetical protein